MNKETYLGDGLYVSYNGEQTRQQDRKGIFRMTTFQHVCSMTEQLLRARGEWFGPTTSHERIDWAVSNIQDLISGGNVFGIAVAEVKRRSGYVAM